MHVPYGWEQHLADDDADDASPPKPNLQPPRGWGW